MCVQELSDCIASFLSRVRERGRETKYVGTSRITRTKRRRDHRHQGRSHLEAELRTCRRVVWSRRAPTAGHRGESVEPLRTATCAVQQEAANAWSHGSRRCFETNRSRLLESTRWTWPRGALVVGDEPRNNPDPGPVAGERQSWRIGRATFATSTGPDYVHPEFVTPSRHWQGRPLVRAVGHGRTERVATRPTDILSLYLVLYNTRNRILPPPYKQSVAYVVLYSSISMFIEYSGESLIWVG